MVVVDDGRDLYTFDAKHPNATNGKACDGHAFLAGPRGAQPPQQVPDLPAACTGCGRLGQAMTYSGHSIELTKWHCERCG